MLRGLPPKEVREAPVCVGQRWALPPTLYVVTSFDSDKTNDERLGILAHAGQTDCQAPVHAPGVLLLFFFYFNLICIFTASSLTNLHPKGHPSVPVADVRNSTLAGWIGA